MTTLIYAEHDNKSLKAATYALADAACQIGGDVHILVAGQNCQAVAQEAASIAGVSKVLLADDAIYANQLSENVAALVKSQASNYSHILAAASTTGKNFLPRAAALLDVNMVSDVSEIVDSHTFVRPIYAGNAFATVKVDESIVLVSIRPSAFELADKTGSADIESVAIGADFGKARFVKEELSTSVRPELSSATVVVSGGRGIGGAEGMQTYIEPLADKLSAAVGASRAVVDAGWAPNDLQVGQTGKIVAPNLYVAVGISGAIQHLAGMKDSKTIVAINNDPEAPIAQVADYFLVADVASAVPELISKL